MATIDSVGTPLLTGIHIKLPPGHVGLLCPRSGLAARFGATVINSPGIIDEDYIGEIKVLLKAREAFSINAGDRIAQLVIVRYETLELESVGSLEEFLDRFSTERGTKGFGSTG